MLKSTNLLDGLHAKQKKNGGAFALNGLGIERQRMGAHGADQNVFSSVKTTKVTAIREKDRQTNVQKNAECIY